MDKIKNISLGGFSFMLEESAYTALSTYLAKVRQYLSHNEDVNEILFDVEQRMAELLKERLIAREVIVAQDVQYLIDVLGKPEQYTNDETAEEPAAASRSNFSFSEQKRKKLYRNPDDKKIGGVLSGLAYYLDIDVTLLRIGLILPLLIIAFVLVITKSDWHYLFLPFLPVILVYLIFWAIVPAAYTTAEKIEMKGEAVNLDTISNFKNSNIPPQSTDWVRSFSDKRLFGVIGGFAARTKLDSTWLRILYIVFTLVWLPWYLGITLFFVSAYLLLALILKKEEPFESAAPLANPLIPRKRNNIFFFLLKGIFILLGALLCVLLFETLAISLFMGSLAGGFSMFMFSEYLPYFLDHTWQLNLFCLSVALFLFLPISLITLLSFKLFRKQFNTPRIWVVANVLCLIIGVLGLLITAGSTARNFIAHYEDEQRIPITTNADTLYVTVNSQKRYTKHLNVDNNRLVVTEFGLVVTEFGRVSIKPTTEKEPFLVLKRESKGSTIQNAKQQMQQVEFPLQINNNHITIPDYYQIKQGGLFRSQRILVKLYVPESKYIYKKSNSTYSPKEELYRVTKDSLQLISKSTN